MNLRKISQSKLRYKISRNMFNFENEELLKKLSIFLGKDKNFMKYSFVKFFICHNYVDDEPIHETFLDEHYLIITYLILLFKDRKEIKNDHVILIIYLLYSTIIEDYTTGTDSVYPALDIESNHKFAKIYLKYSIILSKYILKICKDEKFIQEWKPMCVKILENKENFDIEQLSLKEMELY